jgi:hypothetical protein
VQRCQLGVGAPEVAGLLRKAQRGIVVVVPAVQRELEKAGPVNAFCSSIIILVFSLLVIVIPLPSRRQLLS